MNILEFVNSVDVRDHLKKINCTKENKGYMTLYPHRDDCDGFFISLLTKE